MPLSHTPIISVIIPAYNHEKYVEEAIMSVLNQDGVEFELIVINDGSSDKTGVIISELYNKYGFTYISRDNRGLIKTIVEALQIAKGKYISLLASDDSYLENRLSFAVRLFETLPSGITTIFGKATIVDCNSKWICNYEDIALEPTTNYYYAELMVFNWICAVSITYKAEFIKSFNFNLDSRIEDWPLLLEAAKFNALYDSSYRHSLYRVHGSNTIVNWKTDELKRNLEYVYEKHVEMSAYNQLKLHCTNKVSFNFFNLIYKSRRVLLCALLRKLKFFYRKCSLRQYHTL